MWTDPRMLLGLRSHQACFCNSGVFNPTVQSVRVALNTVRDCLDSGPFEKDGLGPLAGLHYWRASSLV